jgi:hypothetical protein
MPAATCWSQHCRSGATHAEIDRLLPDADPDRLRADLLALS